MKDKISVIYNNVYDENEYEETKRYVFEEYAYEEGWQTLEDVPESFIQREFEAQEETDWDRFEEEMRKLLQKNCYLITGTCGRWDGPAEGGAFIQKFSDLRKVIGHLDYLKIFDKNGHLLISGYHHDGFDSYEMKKLTKKGYDYARSYGFDHDRKLHSTIMKSNFLSALPRLSKEIYGV